jgi:hypothetical protein
MASAQYLAALRDKEVMMNKKGLRRWKIEHINLRIVTF